MSDGQTKDSSLTKSGSLGVRHGGLSGFFNYFLRSFKVTFIILVGLAILGVWSAVTLPREATPEIDIPVAIVFTVYPGSSARDVEELITTPIEDELINIDGLDNLSSSSRLGISTVVAEFEADQDLDEAIRTLREEVSSIRGLPADAESPEVIEISIQDEPVISISLGGIEDERLLSLYADELADGLEDVANVSNVDVAGGTQEEIKIKVNPERLADLGLSIGQLMGVIRSSNINAPFGQLDTEQFNYDLRLKGRFESIGDVAQIPVALPDGSVVKLDTIAEVELGLADKSSESRMSVNGEDSSPAVTLSVRKKTGGNIVRIVDEVKKRISVFEKNNLPEDIRVSMFADRADDIRTQLNNVYRSGVQTLIIVFALLWLFLGWRPALITALAVPLTFSMAFLVFAQAGITLNGISLFSLILSLGLLVDTTIVVVEGISGQKEKAESGSENGNSILAGDSREIKEKKLQERAARVVDQFTKPLIGGTMTTVAAFFPMILVTGVIGQFLRVIPIVVAATLTSSLLVALAFIPPVAVEILARVKHEKPDERWFDQVFRKFRAVYARFIGKMLDARKLQLLFIAGLTVLLVVGLSLPFTGVLRTGLFPAVDIDFMLINIELAPGTKLEKTSQTVSEVESILTEVPEVISYVANVGTGISVDIGGGGSSSEEVASFFINLDKERERNSLEVTTELRGKFKEITEAKVSIEEISAGPPTAPPIELKMIGDSVEELDRLSMDMMAMIETIDGAIDVDRNLRNSAGEFNFVFDQEALAAAGLSVIDVAQSLRVSVFGSEVTTFLDQQSEEIAVEIEAVDEAVSSVDDVLSMPILSRNGTKVTLGQVAKVDLESSVDAIRHSDGERTVTITADAEAGFTPNEVTEELMSRLDEVVLPDGYRIDIGGEQQETVETFNQLYRSMIFAVLLILLILVVEFNSYRQPLIIFLSIPLGLIGVLFGLLVFNGQLNFAAFIGLVSLTGIVVNNSIILVDRMNRMRERGMAIKEAVKDAANTRLRPIILTTFTTAGGIAPLIWVDEFFRDMALTLITGLLFSSILTLVLIPILYFRQQTKMERKKEKKGIEVTETKTAETNLSPVP